MILLSIADVKNFMNDILKGTTFNDWEARDVEIVTFTKFNISCIVNKAFLSLEQQEQLTSNYLKWSDLQSIVYTIIKGKTPPSHIKIVLAYPSLELNNNLENIESILINIGFEKGNINITTGTSSTTFSLDKSNDQLCDEIIKDFLQKNNISYQLI